MGSALSIKIVRAEARTPDDFEGAFDRLAREGSQVVIVIGDPMFFAERGRIAELALADRLPSIYVIRYHVVSRPAVGQLWPGFARRAPTRSHLRRQDPEGRQAGDLPIEFSNEAGAGDQC
jgi:hypothetical protein